MLCFIVGFSLAFGNPANRINLEKRFPGAFYRGVYDADYLYVSEGGGLSIYDVSSTWQSPLVGQVTLASPAYDIAKQGDYVYLVTTRNGMKIINVANPAHPRVVSTYLNKYEFYGIDVKGNYAYLADPSYGFVIVDISNPQKPVQVNRIPSMFGSVDVVVKDSTAFVAAGTHGVYILNVENPYSITTTGIINSIGSAWTLKVQDNYAYVVDFFNGLAKVDISNLAQPTTVSVYTVNIANTPCYDVAINGNIGYLSSLTQYDRIDLSAMTTTQVIDAMDYKGRGVCAWDNKVATLQYFGGLKIYDFTNPASYIALSHTPNLASMEKALHSRNYMVVNEPDQGLIVSFNADDPLHPYAINTQGSATNDICIRNDSFFYTLENKYGIGSYYYLTGNFMWAGEIAVDTVRVRDNLVMEGKKAFCSYSQADPLQYGVLAFTMSNETAIAPAGSWASDKYIIRMLSYSNHLYLLFNNDSVLQVLDSSVASQVTTAGSISLSNPIRDIAIKGNYMAMVSQDSQLRIYSLANPAQPELAGAIGLKGPGSKVALNRQYAYVFIPEKGLFEYDLSDLSHPKLTVVNRLAPYIVSDISFRGDVMYVSASREGLWIYDTAPQLPGLKVLLLGDKLPNAYQLSDYAEGTTYSIKQNFGGFCSLEGDTVSQDSCNTMITGTNRFQVIQSSDTVELAGRVNYVSHRINKLPFISLNPGDSYDMPILSYTSTNGITGVPVSYYWHEGAIASDTSVLSVEWQDITNFTIHCLKAFSEPQYVDVLAGYPTDSVYQQYDKERIWVYPNLVENGGLGNASSLNLFGIETCPDKEALGAVSYLETYADGTGDSANGVAVFSFASTNEGIKATLALDKLIPYAANQWYIARMRVCAPENGSVQELSLFNYGGLALPGAEHVDIAGHIYFGISSTWSWIETPLYTHETAPGYFQFFMKPGAAGSIYVDEVQIIKAEPTLIGNIRKRPDLQFFGGDFDTADDSTGWSEENFADSLPYSSISSGRCYVDFSNASSANIQGAKYTGLDGKGTILTPSTPKGKDIGLKMDLAKEAGSFDSFQSLVLLGLYGVEHNAEYTIAQAGDDLIAAAEFGRISGGPYYLVGESRSAYHQFQVIVKNDAAGILSLDDIDMQVDSDTPYYGDPNLFPEDSILD
jgi:hypothetical protein